MLPIYLKYIKGGEEVATIAALRISTGDFMKFWWRLLAKTNSVCLSTISRLKYRCLEENCQWQAA
ncbi:MAG: hypothetical protein ACTS85_01945 [Arsenophonus sp. NC-PG7-MAG3]